jgi:uncharacterized membrane protein
MRERSLNMFGRRNTALVVMTFDREDEAAEVLAAVENTANAGQGHIDDSAIVTKDLDGTVKIQNRIDSGVKTGAVAGGFIGLLLGAVFFPIGGLVLGAAGGALIGKWADRGVDEGFVEKVSTSLKPGGSALFITGTASNRNAFVATLKPFKGELLETSVDDELSEQIRQALATGN